ncbi:MAG: phosphate acyltransferase PlsX [Bacteroidota bacterium]|nr:phosphate acyltransferase PlsX [Bacteroidota bacterium]
MITIALDTMGADFSPRNEVSGAIGVLRETGGRFRVLLIGQKEILERELENHRAYPKDKIEIVDAPEIIEMGEEPVHALRQKRQSSIVVGLQAIKQKQAEAFVSAGNTGAVMSGSTLELGRIFGVSRPMIGSQFPRDGGGYTLVFDVGATVDAKPHWLKEYGIMGSLYSKAIFGVANPSVALLSVGEESTKGNNLTFAAAELLGSSPVNFVGNVEGRDIFTNKADIILCDGFTGNILLKFAESILPALKSRVRRYSEQGFVQKLKAAITASVLRHTLKDFDYQEYGGVPLLGVNGVVIIGHGSSTPRAFRAMLLRAEEMIKKDLVSTISKAFEAEKA